MEESQGDLKKFRNLLTGVKTEEDKPEQQPEQPKKESFPWGENWLSPLNDFLFEPI